MITCDFQEQRLTSSLHCLLCNFPTSRQWNFSFFTTALSFLDCSYGALTQYWDLDVTHPSVPFSNAYFHPRTLPHTYCSPTWHFFSDRREALQHCDLKERNIFYSDDQNVFLIYTRSLSMVPAHSSWNPWNFLRWEQYMCLCYVNKAAFGKPSGHLRMRAGCLEKQYCAERVRTLSPNPTLPTQLLRRGEVLVGAWVQLPMPSDLTNLSSVMKPPQKPSMGSRETPGWWPHGAAGGWCRVGLEAPHPCPGLAPASLPSFLSYSIL